MNRFILSISLMLIALVLAACGSEEAQTEALDTASQAQTEALDTASQAQTEALDTASQAQTEALDTASQAQTEALDTASQAEAASVVNTAQRSAPLDPNGDFHNDSPALVGATGRPQFVEFFTYWCPTCKSMKPVVHQLEADYWGRIDFIYLDRENSANAELVQRFGVRGQPVLFLLDAQGQIIQQWYGRVDESELSSAFESALAG
jgi:thiol-disulfide isomerase/thioredoxin